MINAKKSLGQNFLQDKNIIQKIVSLVNLNDKNVIEIGPGKGALTEEILKKKPKSLSLIEKDNNLFNHLNFKYSEYKILKLYNADILKFDLKKILKKKTVIIGNLPYNISSQILVKIINLQAWPPSFDDLILMFQKEVAEKILGKFSSPFYGRLSILTNYRFKTFKKFDISPNCFSPKPKVKSSLLHFRPIKQEFFKIKNIKNLEKITNILFSGKRKMINKNIKKILPEKEIKKLTELKLSFRPSEIKPELYYKITELFEKRY